MTAIALHFLLGITVIGGLLWGVSRLAERWRNGALHVVHDDPLRVVGRRSLAKGASVVRLSVEDRDLLIGASAKGVELLCELPKTPAPAPVRPSVTLYGPDGQPGRPTFVEALQRALALRDKRP